MYTEKAIADECLRRGAAGYATKDCGEEELRRAVSIVLNGGRHCSDRLRHTHGVGLNAAHPCWARLTPRHQDILLRLGQGTSQKEIAAALGIVPATVAFHVERIRITLGFATTSELVRHAILLSVSDPPARP
jgi:DNA-binding NarL/FixJ family response regulator